MISFIKIKGKLAIIMFAAFIFSSALIQYVFPTQSTVINPNAISDIKRDINYLVASIFDKNVRENNKKIDALTDLAKTGEYHQVAKGVETVESEAGVAFKINVSAMDWQEYKTYTINGKTIQIRVEQGDPEPSQELLEKLAEMYP